MLLKISFDFCPPSFTLNEMKIILASSSPRRQELMKSIGLRFTVRKPEVLETPRRSEQPADYVIRLSREKSIAVALVQPKSWSGLVVAADTVVVTESGKLLEKPTGPTHAERMIKLLAGRTHVVWTGYTILLVLNGKISRRCSRRVKTLVRMRKLSLAGIQSYVRSGESNDKAGAYAAQGLGMGLIESLNGSYTNVVGLPMSQLLEDLETRFGIRTPFHPI